MNRERARPTLLPYQTRWLADGAGLKVIEKARRVGISWTEAYDAVMHAGADGGGNVYYQAYNWEMTRGFIADLRRLGADAAVGGRLSRRKL